MSSCLDSRHVCIEYPDSFFFVRQEHLLPTSPVPSAMYRIRRVPGLLIETAQEAVCVCCFVLLNRYWGIVMYGPGASSWASQGRRTHDPRSPTSQPHPVPPYITWGVRILTLRLNYVAGYTDPLLFLFKGTYNYYVDNQGLVPWRLRRLGKSKVRSAS